MSRILLDGALRRLLMVISIGKHVDPRDTGLILPEHVAAPDQVLARPNRQFGVAKFESGESGSFLFYTSSGDIPFPPAHFRHTCLCMGFKPFDGWEILQKLAVFTGLRLIAGVAGYPPDCTPSRGTPMPLQSGGLDIGGDFTLLSHRAKQRCLGTNI